MRTTLLLLTAMAMLAQQPPVAGDAQTWLDRGEEAYQAQRYQEAAEAFRNAVTPAPGEATPHLRLGETWLAQYIPGAATPENLELATRAEAELQEAFRIEPGNETAILSLASLKYQEAQGQPDAARKLQKLDDAAAWYERAIAVNPENKEAYYSLAVIGWAKWYPAYMAARAQAGMNPIEPGPLRDPRVRQDLSERYALVLDQAVSNLERALQLDPMYDDAMAYMNLLVRERADLRETVEEYASDVQAADECVAEALDTKRIKASATQRPGSGLPLPHRIHVDGEVQEAKLIRQVDAVYPGDPGIRLEGTVRLRAVIGTDGRVQELQFIQGLPLLVKAAMDAVRQWEYRPTLLNGELAEVVTEVNVSFALP